LSVLFVPRYAENGNREQNSRFLIFADIAANSANSANTKPARSAKLRMGKKGGKGNRAKSAFYAHSSAPPETSDTQNNL